MTAEEIYIKLKEEMTADNESSSSPERIFIKNEGQTICTLGMNRSHEIIFVEFKPQPKDLSGVERAVFVHPHPVEMLHDAGWRQAQLSTWEEAEKLLDIIHRSYKKKRSRTEERAAKKFRKRRVASVKAEKPKVKKQAAKKKVKRAAIGKAKTAKAKIKRKTKKKAKAVTKVKRKTAPKAKKTKSTIKKKTKTRAAKTAKKK